MKNFFNYLMVALLFSTALVFVTSCDDDKNGLDLGDSLEFTELPDEARVFVRNHFEEDDVDLILSNTSEGMEGYNVSVRGYKIDFDRNGTWEKIEAKDDGILPADIMALIPTSISGYVVQKYPGRGINEIKKKDYGYQVELAGKPDVELEFDFSGNVFNIDEDDDDDGDDDERIAIENLPEISKTFIQVHFASSVVKEVKKDDGLYEVKFTDKTEVEFYASGEWKKVETDYHVSLPKTVIALLPEKAVSYIASTYPDKTVREIERKGDAFEVELYRNIEIIFDKDGNVWGESGNNNDKNNNHSQLAFESLPQPVKDFVTNHFPGVKVLYVNKTYKEYKIGLTDGTRMDFTMDNQIQAIVSVRGAGIPAGAVLPAIANYVGKNHAGKKMMVYIRQYQGYIVELSGYPVRKVFFDLNGNFLRAY